MTVVANCGNCGAALAGRYCHDCGQDAVPRETVRESLRTQRQRLFRTLHALALRPGLLTQQHLGGAGVRYVAPFTLFLNIVAVFFLFSVATDFRIKSFVEKDSTGHLAQSIARRAERAGVAREVFVERVERRFQGVYTLCVASISLLGYALLFRVVFPRRSSGWRGPFTLALHYLSFVFLVLPFVLIGAHLMLALLPAAPVRTSLLVATASMSFAWLSLAARRLFGDPWPWALAKAAIVLLVGTLIDQAMFVAAVMLTFTLA